MKNQIYPCLWFDGQAKEAATLYCSVFNNAKIIEENPMVVIFELEGKKFMGLNGGSQFKINPSISIFVTCPTIKETNELWKKLLDGGSVMMDIGTYPWSERYGWLKDKFGLTWQIAVVNEPSESTGIVPSFLFTGKNFGRAEEAIQFYSSIFQDAITKLMLYYPPGDENVGKVMYSEFSINKADFIAMDGPGEHDFTFNEGLSLVISCDTQKEIDYYWNKLTEEGNESMCGWLRDKFGVSWQVVPSMIGKLINDPKKAERVMPELLKMKKIDMEKLMNA